MTISAVSSVSGSERIRPQIAATISNARLVAISSQRLAETGREHQPARTQVLERDLAGVILVDGRQVIEQDAAAQPDVEQMVHRQLAARIRQADHHAVDAQPRRQRRDIVDHADHAGVDHRRADARRIGVDEADDIDAELLAPFEQLARQHDGGGAGADEQQPLARRQVVDQPLERRAPGHHQAQCERCGQQEHALLDDQQREQPVGDAQNQRGGAERAQQPPEEIALGRDRPQIVEIGIVQAELADQHDQQHPQDRGVVGQHFQRVRAADQRRC